MILKQAWAQEVIDLSRLCAACNTPADVENCRIKYIGRNGSLPALMKGLRDVPPAEKPAFGQALNALRTAVTDALNAAKDTVSREEGPARAFDFVRKTGGGESEERLAKIGREGAVGASETRHASFGRKAHGERIGAVETRSGHESDDEAAHEACSSAVSASSVCAAFCCSSSLALASALRTDGSDSPSSSANLSKALSQTSAWACIWASW